MGKRRKLLPWEFIWKGQPQKPKQPGPQSPLRTSAENAEKVREALCNFEILAISATFPHEHPLKTKRTAESPEHSAEAANKIRISSAISRFFSAISAAVLSDLCGEKLSPTLGPRGIGYGKIWAWMSFRKSSQIFSGISRNTLTTSGSNCLPDHFSISILAACWVWLADKFGRQ